jgi:hypothetical protein
MSTYGGVPDTTAERERRFPRKRGLAQLSPEQQDAYQEWYSQGSQRWRLGILGRDELNLLDPDEESCWVTAKHIAARHFEKQREIQAEYQADAVKAINKAIRSVVPPRVPWWRRFFPKGAE